MDTDSLTWAQWPTGVPRPTPEEWAAAESRFRKEASAAFDQGYAGDGYVDLSFTMATYNRSSWWDLFFPDAEAVYVRL